MPIWGVRIGFMAIPLMIVAVAAKVGVALGFWASFAALIYLASLFGALFAAAVNFVFLLLPRDLNALLSGRS
jgi:hypothetical protein